MKCNTSINPGSKMALSGAAIEAALKDPNSPRCGYELAEDDLFCPSCGAKVRVSGFLNTSPVAKKDKRLFNKRAPRWVFWRMLVKVHVVNGISLLTLILLWIPDWTEHGIVYGLALGLVSVSLFSWSVYVTIQYIIICVRRLHDIDLNGWLLVPWFGLEIVASAIGVLGQVAFSRFFACIAIIANLVLHAWLGFAKGTKGHNRYGQDPMENDVGLDLSMI